MTIKQAVLALSITLAAALLGGQSAHAEAISTEMAKKPEPRIIVVQAGDSLSKIADENGTTWVRIFDANDAISNPDIINPGQQLRIPTSDEQLPDRYSQVVTVQAPVARPAATTNTTNNNTSKSTNSSSYYVGNGMWCTDYVHSKRPDVPIYGNAGYNWISSAKAQGKATGTTAQAGAVAVMSGHVAYVESVNADGSYVVSEMGWNYKAGNFNRRTVRPGTFGGFIY